MLDIEDFFTFGDILRSAIEQFNSENYENLKNQNLTTLKGNPDLYKIFIGKKKTGLPNCDYPPLTLDRKIRNSKFPVLSILYDSEHIDERHSNLNLDKNNQKNKKILKSSENIFSDSNDNDLKEDLIKNKKGYNDYNFESTISANSEEVKRKSKKSCCDRCEIL